MSKSSAPTIKGGKIFHSDDSMYLQGVERGIEFATEGALSSHGIHPSTCDGYAFMLVIEDRDEEEIDEEFA